MKKKKPSKETQRKLERNISKAFNFNSTHIIFLFKEKGFKGEAIISFKDLIRVVKWK